MKTHTKHTPGPWGRTMPISNGHIDIIDGEGRPIVRVWNHTHGPSFKGRTEPGETVIADARLVHAAPDLLAACKQVLIASEDNGGMDDIDWQGIRDAIAKAEGN